VAREKAGDLRAQENSYEYDDKEIVNGMVCLLMNYKTQRSWPLAEKLVTSIDAHIYNHFKGTLNWQNWQMIKMEIRQKIGDYEGSAMLLQEMQDVNGDLEFVSIRELVLLQVAAEYLARNDLWEKSLQKSEQLLEKLQELPPSMAQQQLATEMHIHLLQNSCYQATGNGKLAELELVKAMVLSESVDMSRWKGD
jgi:hypothetical protein